MSRVAQSDAVLDRSPAWRRRKDQRRPELLEAGRATFEELGYERASLAEIARRAGVSEATVYKYFGSKQDLVRQVIEAWIGPNLDRLDRELPAIDGARQRLQLLAFRHLEEMRDKPSLHRLVYSELRWHDYRESVLYQLNRRYSQIVKWVVQEGMASGELQPDLDPRLARNLLFGGLEHVGWRMVFGGQDMEAEQAAGDLIRQIFGGLAQPAPALPDARLVDRLERAVATLESRCASQPPGWSDGRH